MKVSNALVRCGKVVMVAGSLLVVNCELQAASVTLLNPTATFSQPSGWDASTITDGITNDFAGWAVFDFRRGGAFAETVVVETESDIGFESGSVVTFNLFHVNHNPQHGLGRFRISYTKDSRDIFADGLNSGGDVSANWIPFTPKTALASAGVTLSIQSDGSILAAGANPEKCVYTVTAETQDQGITGFRIEALEDPSLPGNGPGRYPSNGNFVLTEFTASVVEIERPPVPPIPPTPVALKNTAASFSQVAGWNAHLITDGVTNDAAGWAVYDFSRGGAYSETVVMETEDDIGFAEGSVLTFVLYHVNHNPQSGLGRFRISYTTDPRDSFADGLNTGGDVTAEWTVLQPTVLFGTDGAMLSGLPDGSIMVGGANPTKSVYTVSAEVVAQNITGFRLEALEDPALPASGPGRSPNGNFVLTEFTAGIAPKISVQPLVFSLSEDFSPGTNPSGAWSYGAKPSLDGEFSTFSVSGLNPFEYWQLVAGQEPTIYHNGTAETITIAGGQGVFPPGTTFLYSGTDGASNGFGVVRFTAPASTNYLVETAVAPVYDGSLQGDTDYHVVKNGAEVFGLELAPSDKAGYTNVIALEAGDTLDFMVGRGADESGTSSGLKIDVRLAPTDQSVPSVASRIILRNTAATFSQVAGWNASLLTDGVTNDVAGWAVFDFGRNGAFGESAAMETAENVGFPEGSVLTFMLYHVNHNPGAGLGRFRISYTTDSRDDFADGLNSGGDVTANWIVLMPDSATATDGATLAIESDGSLVVGGANPDKVVYTVTASVAAQGITGFRLEAIEDASFPDGGPGRSPNGNFVLSEFAVSIAPIIPPPPIGNFDLAKDFSPSSNPSGAWSYGAKPSLDGHFSIFEIRGLNPFEYWQLVAGQEPTIYHNGTAETITIAGGQGVFPPGTTFLYSGTDGASNGFGVVRFTAPASTNYLVETAVAPVYDGSLQGDTDYHVVKNGAEVFGLELAPSDKAGYTNVIALEAGDTLDFMVGRGADESGTSSGLKIDVRLAPTDQSVPPNPVNPPTGLVAWWPLDGDGRDVAGGNDGILLGTPAFSTGYVREAMEFDGADDSVKVAAASALNVGARSGLTIEGWIYPTDLSQLRPIVEWNDGSVGVHFWTGVDVAAPGDGVRTLFANLVDSNGANHQIRSAQDLLVVEEWQHVALSYDKATGIAAIYHNGILVTQANLGTFTPQTTGDLHLGNRPAGPFSGILWKGKLDEISLYNRALPSSEIARVFAAGAGGKVVPANPPVNHAPIAKMSIEPLYSVWPDQENVMVISVDGIAADLILDGSLSSDEDGDALAFQWTRNNDGSPFAAGSMVTNAFEVGFHDVTLLVDDGKEFGAETLAVEVLTLEDALDELYGVLIESEISRKDKRPLLATLGRVWDSFTDGRLNAGAKQLRAFQQKARAHLDGKNAETAKRLIHVAQQIIDAINDYLVDHEEPWRDAKDKYKDDKK